MKMLITMMMMMLVQVASAHEVTITKESKWELTLVTPDEMIDMPGTYHSHESCLMHGIQILITRETTREFLLGFVCEWEEDDERTG